MNAAGFCKLTGAILILVALWGFIAGDRVLIFHVNTAHNMVYLLSGLLALLCGAGGERPARGFCFVFGTIYGIVALLGFAGVEPVAGGLHLNPADNWLHLAFAVAFLFVGSISTRSGQRLPVLRAG